MIDEMRAGKNRLTQREAGVKLSLALLVSKFPFQQFPLKTSHFDSYISSLKG